MANRVDDEGDDAGNRDDLPAARTFRASIHM